MAVINKLNPLIRIKAIWHVLKDRRTPLWAKGCFLVLALIYIVSPFDLNIFPDFIIGLGWLDEIVVIPFLAWLTTRFAPRVVRSDAVQAVLRKRAERKARKAGLPTV